MMLTKHIATALRTGLVALVLIMTTAAHAVNDMGREPGAQLLARCQLAQRLLGPSGSQGLSADQRRTRRPASALSRASSGATRGLPGGRQGICGSAFPPGFSAVQGVPLVAGYLQAHPDRLEEEAHLLVFLALTAAYPCKP